MPSLLEDPKHWRDRAEEARRQAAEVTDPEARRMLLNVAASYEKMARNAEARLQRSPSKADDRA